MDIKSMNIAIIGGGNLGRSVAEGFLKAGIDASRIVVTRRRTQLLDDLSAKGIRVEKDNKLAVNGADLIIVSVKPYQAVEVISELKSSFKHGQFVASLMTGISIAQLKELLPLGVIPFRVMPNTAVALQQSMTCITAPDLTDEQNLAIKELLSTLGEVIFMNKELMIAATGLVAC